MRRLLLSSLSLIFITSTGIAQNGVQKNEEAPSPEIDRTAFETTPNQKLRKSSAVTIWSEDFANGIPSTWTNAGFDMDVATGALTPNPLCLWEYRGPNTTPDITRGSRGQFSGSGPTIASTTSANGFIIFDSDYLDSDGISGNRGNGTSPAPHIGTLSTDTIDLTGYPYVQVVFESRARQFQSFFKLAVSNDGGVTYPDTVEFHQSLSVNSTNSAAETVNADISNTAGNQSLVVLQLVFEADNVTNPGYYYWQLDDMEIQEIPAHSLQFTEFNGAPANDIIYPANSPEYGNPQVDMVEPIIFDSNILNFGVLDQTNVRLVVSIKDGSGQVISTLQSPTLALLASGDTGSFVDFTTSTAWTPSAVGTYRVIFSIESDSIPSAGISEVDSITIQVNDFLHGGHFNRFNNDIGTQQDRIALGQAFTFPAGFPAGQNTVDIDGVNIRFSADSDPDGQVIVEVYDTAGFSYGASGGPAGNPLTVASFALDTGSVGTWAFVDFSPGGTPLQVPAGSGIYIIVNLIPTPGNIVQIGNDQTIVQPSGLIAMQRDDGVWFTGYSNSRSLSNLLMEVVLADGSSLGELKDSDHLVSIFPQPSSGEINLEFYQGGSYNLRLMSYSGNLIHEEQVSVNAGETMQRNFSDVARGVYLLEISDKTSVSRKKILIK